jgi:hypothetical protein
MLQLAVLWVLASGLGGAVSWPVTVAATLGEGVFDLLHRLHTPGLFAAWPSESGC